MVDGTLEVAGEGLPDLFASLRRHTSCVDTHQLVRDVTNEQIRVALEMRAALLLENRLDLFTRRAGNSEQE